MNELIEQLKDKTYVRAFGLMTPIEQDVYKKVGKENCVYFLGDKGCWDWRETSGDKFSSQIEYAIKPNYKPEPEYVDLEIVQEGYFLGIRQKKGMYPAMPFDFTHLHCLLGMPKFWGFYLADNVEVRPEWVGRYFPKVNARFKK